MGEQPPEYQPYQQPYGQQPPRTGSSRPRTGSRRRRTPSTRPRRTAWIRSPGLPYSDKSKLVAGLLQVLIPLGIGRMYMGHTGLGVAQLLVTIFTCGIGALWPFIDGIMILVGNPRDANGRPMKMS